MAGGVRERGPVVVGVIGAGWRAESFLRIAAKLPERFRVVRVLARTEASAARIERAWGVPGGVDLDRFLSETPLDFAVIAVPREIVSGILGHVVQAGVPALIETPPSGDLASLFQLYEDFQAARVEIAEQYQYQPHHAARLAAIRGGLIGDARLVRQSVAHAYHGISLIRLALGVKFEEVEIRADAVTDEVVSPRGRDGWKNSAEKVESTRIIALLRFASKSAVFDFSDPEQYYSPIRSRHISVYGTRGEINDDQVSYLTGADGVARGQLTRDETGIEGDLDGKWLRRITLGERVLFDNGFPGARLSDDEIAVAEVMTRMVDVVDGGAPVYGLAEACHDQYLSALIDQAVATGSPVRSGSAPWAPSAGSRTHEHLSPGH